MNTKFCMATALAADWGIVCQWFLRRFDVAYHDIAKSREEIDCMIETLEAVFIQGRVVHHLLRLPAASGASRDASLEDALPRPLANRMAWIQWALALQK